MKNNLYIFTATSLALSMTMGIANVARAASITPFSFTTNFSTDGTFDPTKDVRLDSVLINANTINDFELINQVTIISNNQNLLASVRGPNTPSDPLVTEGPITDFPTGADIAASLGNLNLSSLVNTSEAPGTAVVDVFFSRPVSTFFFWERGGAPGSGGNSSLQVDALSEDGNTILASYKILAGNYTDAGYSLISTSGPNLTLPEQAVGSIGLHLNGATTTQLRLSIVQPGDNGPDFKIIGAQAVPEPSSLPGAVVALTGISLLRRRTKTQKK